MFTRLVSLFLRALLFPSAVAVSLSPIRPLPSDILDPHLTFKDCPTRFLILLGPGNDPQHRTFYITDNGRNANALTVATQPQRTAVFRLLGDRIVRDRNPAQYMHFVADPSRRLSMADDAFKAWFPTGSHWTPVVASMEPLTCRLTIGAVDEQISLAARDDYEIKVRMEGRNNLDYPLAWTAKPLAVSVPFPALATMITVEGPRVTVPPNVPVPGQPLPMEE